MKKEPNTNVAFENPQYAQGPKVHVCGCLTAEIVLWSDSSCIYDLLQLLSTAQYINNYL